MRSRVQWRPLFALVALLWFVVLAPNAHAATIAATITTALGNSIPLTLETATAPAERERGLMQRESLAPHDGMAFFFPYASIQKFWMKNTILPLDIMFVDTKNRITFIAHGVPQSLEPVGPDTPVITVIEIAAGGAAKLGIKPGDTVTYDTQTLTHLDIR